MKRGGSLSFLVGTISNVLVMEIGWTDVGSGGYILVSCAHSNTSFYCFNVKIVIVKICLSHFFQGLKKLGISIETSYTNIQKLVINHLQV